MKNQVDERRRVYNTLWAFEFDKLAQEVREQILAAPDGKTSVDFAVRIERLVADTLDKPFH